MALIDLNIGLVSQAYSTAYRDIECLHVTILLVLSTSVNRLLVIAFNCIFDPAHQHHAVRSLGISVPVIQPYYFTRRSSMNGNNTLVLYHSKLRCSADI